jgi:hypothetical protein
MCRFTPKFDSERLLLDSILKYGLIYNGTFHNIHLLLLPSLYTNI